ncbi:MAG TPA: single-stranded DNA-binding protein [Bacillales bacterium]|nr:single-stranded DNA-binding protein [Bacillales bacterium]
MGDVNELLEEAIKETKNLNQGEVFLVKDLFKGYVWNRIPRKDRLLLGTLFLNRVSKMNGNLKAIEKTSSNQQRYIKESSNFKGDYND